MNKLSPSRREVMLHVEDKYVDAISDDILIPVEKNWQPSDFLPASNDYETFIRDVKELQQSTQGLSYDFWAVLIGDTITEEALPTYESWLAGLYDVNFASDSGWARWTKAWTAEENRHGDLLNKYLYLSGRIDMRAMESSIQYLLADGMDIKTDDDPYRTFVYTSFQELATNVSHARVAKLAREGGCESLSKMCAFIAADEARHAKAYMTFVEKIFEVDPDEMMLALADMMKKKIVMPAHNLREIGVKIGDTFCHFSDAAQRIGVYTSEDYIDIMERLLERWDISNVTELKDSGEKARDYLMALPDRMRRVISRLKIPTLEYEFSWIS